MDERFKAKIMKSNFQELVEKYKYDIKFDEIMSKYSWFNLGGPAETFYKPKDKNELIKFLKFTKNFKNKINIIGAGSNTLIRDGGIKDVTIKLSNNFSYLRLLEDNIIEAGASTLDKKLSNFATENSLSGFEFLSCIPGSIGGAIVMNCGCYDEDISKIFVSCKAIDYDGKEIEIGKKDIEFFYRGTSLKRELIIVSAKFKGTISKKEKVLEKQLNLIKKKQNSQPKNVKTCGSTFKNTKDYKAWELIQKSNCENFFVGGAKISPKHANFFLNDGKASSTDVEKLIEKVQAKVLEKTGVSLDLELKIIGDKHT